MVEFISIVLFATLLKLSSSIDDAIWLTKLVHKESKSHRSIIEATYLIALIIITLASYFIYLIGNKVIFHLTNSEELLSIISSLVLMTFSLIYLRKNHEKEIRSSINTTLRQKVITTFSVSIIGSIDELLLYITVLGTGKIIFTPLLIGTIIASGIVIIIVSGITRVTTIMSIINKIPVWLVIFCIGLITLAYSIYKAFEEG